MTLYDRFADTKEEGFRKEFIKPLLMKLGFNGISHEHGVNEFGKDFVFSELDRIGHMRHMVIQAKHEKTIKQGVQVDQLITQIRQCFNVAYTLPSSPHESRFVCAVYIFNTGEITDNAETQFRASIENKAMAANTHFFGGDVLQTLSGAIDYQGDAIMRKKVFSLMAQTSMNVGNWRQLLRHADNVDSVFLTTPSMLHGLEDFMVEIQLHFDSQFLQDVIMLWQKAATVENIRQRLLLSNSTAEELHKTRYLLKQHCQDAINIGTRVENRLNRVFANLNVD